MKTVLLCFMLACASALLFTQIVQARQYHIIRHVDLIQGAFQTTRVHAETGGSTHRRRMRETTSDDHQVWAIGFDGKYQIDVMKQLQSEGAHLLHPVPGRNKDSHHWLVKAKRSSIVKVLQDNHHVTAEPLPLHMKPAAELPTSLKSLVEKSSTQSATLLALAPGLSQHQVTQQLQSQKSELTMVVNIAAGGLCKFTVAAKNHAVHVTACVKALPAITTWLTRQPYVTYVSLRTPTATPLSTDGGQLTSSPTTTADDSTHEESSEPQSSQGSYDKLITSELAPLWRAGITGQGQVVGLVDTGLDMDSCFLWDPDFADYRNGSSTFKLPAPHFLPNNAVYQSGVDSYVGPVSSLPNVTVFHNTSNRKVVQYVMWADKVDDDDGHGTHTGATIAGSAYGYDALDRPLIGTGIAPGAKLAVFDTAVSPTEDLSLYDSQDPGQIYEIQRQAGARITSNSWGNVGNYTYMGPDCYMMDMYAYSTNDTLHIFAAGNSGKDTSQGLTGTVEAPANCKNVLSVGAAENWMPEGLHFNLPVNLTDAQGNVVKTAADFTWADEARYGQLIFKDDHGTDIAMLDGRLRDFRNIVGANSWFKPLFGQTLQVILWDAYDNCSTSLLQIPKDADGKPLQVLVLIRADSWICDLDQIHEDLVNSGAAAAILYDGSEMTSRFPFLEVRQNVSKVAFPSAALKYEPGSELYSLINATMYADVVAAAPQESPSPSAGNNDTTDSNSIVHRKLASLAKQKLSPDVVVAAAHNNSSHQSGQSLKTVTVTFVQEQSGSNPRDNVAYYSAYGSNGGLSDAGDDSSTSIVQGVRIKPEVVAPGYIMAAASDGSYSGHMDQCAVTPKLGTSMATPVVSGSAALIRQYFVDGYYPTGSPKSLHAYEPSAPLLKALLIAGASTMTGISVANRQPLAAPPYSNFQGFGRVDLPRTIPIQANSEAPSPVQADTLQEAPWKLQVIDNAWFDRDDDWHAYFVNIPDGSSSGVAGDATAGARSRTSSEDDASQAAPGSQRKAAFTESLHDTQSISDALERAFHGGAPGASKDQDAGLPSKQLTGNARRLHSSDTDAPLNNSTSGATSLVATLVWHDIPAFPNARHVLVNNLDLVVYGPLSAAGDVTPQTQMWRGNGVYGGDYVNNVEKVVIPVPLPGVYYVQVRSVYLFWGARPQSYSLVVLGNYEGDLESPYNPAYASNEGVEVATPPSL